MSQQEIWMIRHAFTLENERNIMIGHSDPPLSEKGVQDAHALAKRLADQPASRLFCSPLVRAKTTAQIIAAAHRPHLSIEESLLLREIHFGIIEGLPKDTALEKYRVLMEQAQDPTSDDFGFPNGELRSEVVQRLMDFFATISHLQSGDPIWVVTHGGLIGLGIAKAFDLPLGAFRQFQPPHASVTRFIVEYDNHLVHHLTLIGHHPLSH